ncbi:mechanosensitive ion channel family protein [uncultured Sphaerochaeta sp.]|uniref:mechanosensitive ion channel family protein n=1 Tax=uncultured Sphaerochaeta sp. TaxID=886478 RepID=UPI002A0A85F7|nr:mechanosensitive ion channel family protein [uncultured Sphaerochaeta sp.]
MEQILKSTFWTDLLKAGQNWMINELPGLLIALVLFFIALKILNFSLKKLKKTLLNRADKNDKLDTDETEKRIITLTSIIHNLIKIILWVIFVMIILQKFGINIAPILAGAGVIGLAIGFGAQELVRDFISGFFIILENQIRSGDVAIINGTGGLVEKIEFRTTILRDFSGVVHIFQNDKISNMSNMTKEWSAMIFDIRVAYKEDPQVVMDLMKQVGEELENDPEFKDRIIEPIDIFGVDEFADSAIIIKARLKTKPIQQWAVGREYRKRLKYAFDQHDIEIPFPHTTVCWDDAINPLKLDVNNQVSE